MKTSSNVENILGFNGDYCPSIIEINFSVTREKSYLKTIWDYDNANFDKNV
jgi:hypothetical protein